MDKPSSGPTDPESLSFEEALVALGETVRRLEQGGLTIDESVALFERGMALAEVCNARLDAAELRISQLTARPDGTVEAAPFDG